MYILELKTVQSSAIRVLIEALKEILTDVNIMFDENGNLSPDEIVAVRFENNYDTDTTEEEEE